MTMHYTNQGEYTMKTFIICTALVVAINSAAYAQDIESKLSGNTATQGFTVKDNSTTSLFTVRGDGKTGIGTVSPTAQLHVAGTGGLLVTGTFGSGAIPATGSGTRLMFYPKKGALRSGSVNGTLWDDTNIGNNSIAMGSGTTASGGVSFATGDETNASGWYSTAMGLGTNANAWASTAIGSCNVGGGSTATWVATDPLFEIGNGTSPAAKSNAVTVLKNGSVGIGTATPTAVLHVAGTYGFLVTGTLGNGTIPATGIGTRMMFYPGKAAFRAGYVDGTQWDDANIGNYSTAMGLGTTASGQRSTAMGQGTTASGLASTAMGWATHATGSSSTAMGDFTSASGDYSTAMGESTHATGSSSTAMGDNTTANGNHSTAMGESTSASALCDVALGLCNVGGGAPNVWIATDPLFEIGNGTNSWTRANAMTVLKNGNVGIGTATPQRTLHLSSPSVSNELIMEVQNGQTDWKKWDFTVDGGAGNPQNLTLRVLNDAGTGAPLYSMTWLANGNVGIGTNTAGYKLEVNGTAGKPGGGSWSTSSDIRLKNIDGDYARGLNDILKLRSIRFHYKPGNPRHLPSEPQEIGFVAQEVAEVFPECVTEGKDGYLDFNMHAVNVAMVNAVKELNGKLDAERARVADLKDDAKEKDAEIEALKLMNKELKAEKDNEIASLREELSGLRTLKTEFAALKALLNDKSASADGQHAELHITK
jgi:hypothetical protein